MRSSYFPYISRLVVKYAALLALLIGQETIFSESAVAESQKEACEAIATTISTVLKREAQKTLILNGFDTIETAKGIKEDLAAAFKAQGITVQRAGRYFRLNGDCVILDNTDPVVLKIVATLNDFRAEPVQIFNTTVKEEQSNKIEKTVDAIADVVEANGASVDLENTITDTTILGKDKIIQEKANKAVKQHLDKSHQPTASLTQFGVKPSEESSFEVSLLFKGVDVEATYQETKPVFVDKKPVFYTEYGEYFEIRIRNHSRLDAAVRISIDGVSTYVKADDSDPKIKSYKENDLYLVRSNGELKIKGWFIDLQNVHSFVIKDLTKDDTNGDLPGAVEKYGMVSVSFYPAWNKGFTKPEFLETVRSPGTDLGPVIADTKQAVEINFDDNVLLSTVNLYYDVQVEGTDAPLPNN